MHGCIIAEVVQFFIPSARTGMPEQMSRTDLRFHSPVSHSDTVLHSDINGIYFPFVSLTFALQSLWIHCLAAAQTDQEEQRIILTLSFYPDMSSATVQEYQAFISFVGSRGLCVYYAKCKVFLMLSRILNVTRHMAQALE